MFTQALLSVFIGHSAGLLTRQVPFSDAATEQDVGHIFENAMDWHPVYSGTKVAYFCPGMPNKTVYGTKAHQDWNKDISLAGYGTIKAREYGLQKDLPHQKFALAIHQVNSNGAEWDPVARKLADHDWHVLVPNWSSNPKTDPIQCVGPTGWSQWKLFQGSFRSNLDDILKLYKKDKFDALLGFSWGGWVAGMRALYRPETVERLVLVAPAFLEEEELANYSASRVSTAVFWGEDDRWVPFQNTKFVRRAFGQPKEFEQEPGDHCIHPVWENKIVKFVLNEEDTKKA